MNIREREMESKVVDPADDPERKVTNEVHPVVEQMETEWPEMTKEFRRLQRQQYELFLKKQHDYGPGNISVGTMLQTPEEIQLSLTGLWFRLNDKIQRLKNLVVMGEPDTVGEAIDDTFQDLSIYGIIAQIVKQKKFK